MYIRRTLNVCSLSAAKCVFKPEETLAHIFYFSCSIAQHESVFVSFSWPRASFAFFFALLLLFCLFLLSICSLFILFYVCFFSLARSRYLVLFVKLDSVNYFFFIECIRDRVIIHGHSVCLLRAHTSQVTFSFLILPHYFLFFDRLSCTLY